MCYKRDALFDVLFKPCATSTRLKQDIVTRLYKWLSTYHFCAAFDEAAEGFAF